MRVRTVQAFACAFLFRTFPQRFIQKSIAWALAWAVPVASVDAALFYYYSKTDSSVPRFFAVSSAGTVFMAYFLVVFVFNAGKVGSTALLKVTPKVWKVSQKVGKVSIKRGYFS